MTAPTNLYSKYSLKGDREDLIDKIFNTSPTETPVVTSFGRGSATNTLHEWQRDSLATANKDNAIVDGDEFSGDALTPTERVGNYCQIFAKKPLVSRRANLVKKAGRAAELGYQKAKAMLEIKRDLGVQNYFNTSHGAGGSTAAWTAGAPTTAPTAGTGRAFTEALLKTVVQASFIASGEVPSMVVLSPNHKTVFSSFTGIAVNREQVAKGKQARIVGGADVYMSDFGEMEIVPHYLMAGGTDVHLLNTEYGEIVFLDGFRTEDMGKTGDSEKKFITADVTLALRASKAFAKVADLTGG